MNFMSYDCFISYSSSDLRIAEELHGQLCNEGFNCWFDKARLAPGFDWHREVEEGCESSRVVLPILTPRWGLSEWTKFETYGAEVIIPLVFEGTWADVTTPPLESYQAEKIELTSLETVAWTRLFRAIRRCLAQTMPQKVTRVAHLRYRANDYFVGREKELIRIHEELHRKPRAVLTQGRVRAISAMGGAGKTTLARQYAEKFWKCYPQMFWVNCRLGFESQFAHIHDMLFPDRAHVGMQDTEKAVTAFRALHAHDPRLLILDNAESETSIMSWIPKAGGCHTLITSRYANWSAAIKAVQLDVLEKEPAMRLIWQRSGHLALGSEYSTCEQLVERVGYLPLALEQAAAYIEQQGEGFGLSDYLRLYDAATLELLSIGALGSTEYPDSVITTWKPTVDKLKLGARTILKVLSFFAATPVPTKLVVDAAPTLFEIAKDIDGTHSLSALGNDEVWIRSELTQLKAYSLLRSDGVTCSLHPLLQLVERLSLKPLERDKLLSQAIQVLIETSPEANWRPESRASWELLSPHAEQLLLHQRNGHQSPNADLLDRLGDAYAARGLDERAVVFYRDAWRSMRESLGAEDTKTLSVLHSLAFYLAKTGQVQEAEPLQRELVEIRERLSGRDHHDTIGEMHNLAFVLHHAGKRVNTIELLRKVIEGYKKAVGPTHRDTLTAVQDLGVDLGQDGKHLEAESLLKEALAGYEDTVGTDDIDTLRTLTNLGTLYEAMGNTHAAEEYLEKATKAYERLLGEEHPATLGAMTAYTNFLGRRGLIEQAEPRYQRILAIRERVQGLEHDDTLIALNNVGWVLHAKGDLSAAETIFSRALEARERVSGSEHHQTLNIVHNLAALFEAKGDFEKAEQLHFRVLASRRERVLGGDHPETLSTMTSLIDVLAKAGRNDEADSLRHEYVRRVADHEVSLPPLTLRQAALELYRCGDYARAEKLYERILHAGFEVADTHGHLARVFLTVGREREARTEVELAEQHLAEGKPYLTQRVRYFQVLFGLLDGDVPTNALLALKQELGRPDVFMEWDLGPCWNI